MTFVDKIIERGIIFLLIFTPLAFGTVQQWSVAVMEIVAFSIFFLYVIKRILEMPAQCHSREESPPDRDSNAGSPPDRHSREGSPPDCHSRESGNLFFYERPRGLTTLFILFAAMIALALFQMVPLPEGVLKLISPVSLSTYATFGNAPAGAYHPISINPEATRRELFRVLAYAAIFFVIVCHYRTKEQVHSLVKTILAMGCFLVIFAILQKMTWNGRIFWIYPVDEGVPMAGVKRS